MLHTHVEETDGEAVIESTTISAAIKVSVQYWMYCCLYASRSREITSRSRDSRWREISQSGEREKDSEFSFSKCQVLLLFRPQSRDFNIQRKYLKKNKYYSENIIYIYIHKYIII